MHSWESFQRKLIEIPIYSLRYTANLWLKIEKNYQKLPIVAWPWGGQFDLFRYYSSRDKVLLYESLLFEGQSPALRVITLRAEESSSTSHEEKRGTELADKKTTWILWLTRIHKQRCLVVTPTSQSSIASRDNKKLLVRMPVNQRTYIHKAMQELLHQSR